MIKLLKDIKKNFILTILIMGIITSYYGLWMTFVLGFHSFDMAQNLIFIRDDAKIDFLEKGIIWDVDYIETKVWSGGSFSLEETYVEGVGYLIHGIFITMLGIFAIGYAIGKLEK